MLRLSDCVVVLDCLALVAGSYAGHVPVRVARVELPYQATAEAVQAADVAGQSDTDTESQVAATTQAPLRCKRKRSKRLTKDLSSVNAGEAAANRRHAAIQPVLQSAFAVFQDWLSKQDVQRLPDALRSGDALPSVTAATEAAMPGPACHTPAFPSVPTQQLAGSGDTPAREGDLDLLALAELKAVLKPKFRFLASAGELELLERALADARAASGAAHRSVGPHNSLLAFHGPSAASTAGEAQHCSTCLNRVPPTCQALSSGASTGSGAQHCRKCLSRRVLPPGAPHAGAVASAGADEWAGVEGSAQGCNLFDVLIGNEGGAEREALAFQTRVLVPPRARFLLSDVTRDCALCCLVRQPLSAWPAVYAKTVAIPKYRSTTCCQRTNL